MQNEERELVAVEAVLESRGIPQALIKALGDPFIYALGLRDGTVFVFEEARLSSDLTWVHLGCVQGPGMIEGGSTTHWTCPGKFNFERGVDVRVSEITWVADAPWGS